ncbi:MAG: M20 family metallopeptidase [Acidobacteriota bacterium]
MRANSSDFGQHQLPRRKFLTALSAGALLAAGGQEVANNAERTLAAVDDSQDLEILQQMIRIRSYSGGGEEGRLARFVTKEMESLGLETQLQEVEAGRFNAVGILPGRGAGTSLMLNGHLDTNPVGLGWTVDPLAGLVQDQMVYGIGVSNMKASCAAFLGATRALVRAGSKLRGDLILAYVVGELQGGIGTLKLLEEGIRADTFVVGEPTDLAVVTLHAASLTVQINTLGITRHLSKMEESVSAIDTMYEVIERIKSMRFSGPDNPEYASVRRVNVGSIRAGLGREYQDWRPGQVPDFATIKMSVRFGPGQSEESVLSDIHRELDALAREDPRVRTEIAALRKKGLPPPRAFEISREERIVSAVTQAHRQVLGSEPRVGAVAPYR